MKNNPLNHFQALKQVFLPYKTESSWIMKNILKSAKKALTLVLKCHTQFKK